MGDVSGGMALAGVVLGGIGTALLIGCLVVYFLVLLKQQKYLKNITEIHSLQEEGILTVAQRKINTKLNSKMLKKWESKRSTIKMGAIQIQKADCADPVHVQQRSGTERSSPNPDDIYCEMPLSDRIPEDMKELGREIAQQHSREMSAPAGKPEESDQSENPYFDMGVSDRIQGTFPQAST